MQFFFMAIQTDSLIVFGMTLQANHASASGDTVSLLVESAPLPVLITN